MSASPQTTLRRISLAVDAGAPPSPVDIHNWTLCRRTSRSHENLLTVAALVNGDYVSFLDSLGYDPKADPTRNLDHGYWRMMCYWIAMYIPAFEKEAKQLMSVLALPDQADVAKGLAKGLGLPTDFLEYFTEHSTEILGFLDNIRPLLGAMAELKLVEQIAIGDPATVRWALPRLLPKQYHLANTAAPPPPENVRVIFGNDDN